MKIDYTSRWRADLPGNGKVIVIAKALSQPPGSSVSISTWEEDVRALDRVVRKEAEKRGIAIEAYHRSPDAVEFTISR